MTKISLSKNFRRPPMLYYVLAEKNGSNVIYEGAGNLDLTKR
jgi:hypothetical protein